MANEPIVKFYIQNYNSNGSVVTNETLFQTVPISGTPAITTPKIKNEMGKAGSLEFGLERNSPLYDSLLQMKTIIRVTYFNNTIFRGRVLTIDKSMARTRTVHCEGDFAFLLDSPQPGSKEDTRPTITVLAYLQQIINNHNSYIDGDNVKKFTLGEVPGQYTNSTPSSQRVKIPSEKAKQQFGDTSWNTSMDRIEDLLSTFGGYFRTRYNPQNGTTYLDWFDNYYNSTINSQSIEITKNLIDISGPTEIENLFTIVIPIGRKESENVYVSDYWPVVQSNHAKVPYITVPELATIPLYSDAELNANYHHKSDYQNAINRYGKVWKTVTFENANTPELLFAYAKDWMKNNFSAEITQWSITALDMKIIDSDNQMILCGDRVRVVHPEVGSSNVLTVISAEYDLYNPDKNKYSIGIPNQQLNAAYGVKNKTDSKGKAKGGASGKKPTPNTPSEAELDVEAIKKQVESWYMMKSESGEDIPLDDALAYLRYNTDGTPKDSKQAAKDIVEVKSKLLRKYQFATPEKRREIRIEAINRGVKPEDTQLLMDFLDPYGEKLKQSRWKADTGNTFVNTYGLDLQTTTVVLNQRTGQSQLASLVDDDGEWTQEAIRKGYPMFAESAKIKQMAIDSRRILQGKTVKTEEEDPLSQIKGAINNFSQSLFGMDMNLAGYWDFDFDFDDQNIKTSFGDLFGTQELTDAVSGLKTKAVDLLSGLGSFGSEETPKTSGSGSWISNGINFLGGLFTGNNTEAGNKEFGLNSFGAVLEGTESGGSAGFKAGSSSGSLNGWDITLNKPITYTANGHTYTVPAKSIAADDMHFTAKYDSLRAKLLVVDTLLADYARINTLEALKAKIDDLTSNTIVANTCVSASTGLFGTVVTSGLAINTSGGVIPNLVNPAKCYNQCSATNNNDGTVTLTMYPADGSTPGSGDIVTFSSALAGWESARAKVVIPASSMGVSITAKWPAATYGEEESVTYTLGNDGDNAVKLTFTAESGNSYTAAKFTHNKYTSGESAGWLAARNMVTIPSSGTGTSITAKWPDSTQGEQETRTYTLSNDGDNAVKLTYLHENGNTYTSAKITHNKYDAGWGAAQGKVVIPASASGASITPKWPSSTVGEQVSRTYTLTNDGNNKVVLRFTSSGTNYNAAVLTHNKYNAGWDAAIGQDLHYGSRSSHNSGITKTTTYISGYVWHQNSSGTWTRGDSFSFSTGAEKYSALYYESSTSGVYYRIATGKLVYS